MAVNMFHCIIVMYYVPQSLRFSVPFHVRGSNVKGRGPRSCTLLSIGCVSLSLDHVTGYEVFHWFLLTGSPIGAMGVPEWLCRRALAVTKRLPEVRGKT